MLVVEDNRDSADCMALLLGHFGSQVRVVYERAAAIEAAVSFKSRLVLIDLGMPGIDGIAVGKQLRQTPELSTTHLAAVTGDSDEAHRQSTSQAGFDDYLVKPVDVDRLKELLQRAEHDIF